MEKEQQSVYAYSFLNNRTQCISYTVGNTLRFCDIYQSVNTVKGAGRATREVLRLKKE